MKFGKFQKRNRKGLLRNSLLNDIVLTTRRFSILRGIAKIIYFGKSRYCPICGSYCRRFLPFGVIGDNKRTDAMCISCGSLERHRLVWKFFINHTNLFESRKKSMLHIAPEKMFARVLCKEEYIEYLTADLYDPDVMVKMDITNIQYPNDKFDIIYCSHVLEHIQEDRKAMHELYRVLKPGGWAVLQVPITTKKTFEDPSVTDPIERERLFGQYDHVRRYGPDFKDRLREAGFKVKIIDTAEVVGKENVKKFGVIPNKDIFYCIK